MKRYAVHPGPVRSRNDGGLHWVGFAQLVRLYGVPPHEAFEWIDGRGLEWDAYVHLFPRADGRYSVPDTITRHLSPHAPFGDDPSGWCGCADCDPRPNCGCPTCSRTT